LGPHFYSAAVLSSIVFYSDTDSERASSIEDYQITCAEFITDISKDYADWVDRYNLDSKETDDRKRAIENIRINKQLDSILWHNYQKNRHYHE